MVCHFTGLSVLGIVQYDMCSSPFSYLAPTSAPLTPMAVVRDSRTIVCSWSPPPAEHHNGIIVEYQVNITEVNTGLVFIRVSTTTSLEITSLHPDYTYQWTVTAVTVEAGPYTSVSNIRTPADGKETAFI